jgi:hypothetical protein
MCGVESASSMRPGALARIGQTARLGHKEKLQRPVEQIWRIQEARNRIRLTMDGKRKSKDGRLSPLVYFNKELSHR